MGREAVLLGWAGSVATLTFNRPRVKNAINEAVVRALGAHLDTLETHPGLRALVVMGAGGSFVSGGDLKALHGAPPEEAHERVHRPMTASLRRLAALPIPVICALEGYALGGGAEIALACDLRVADPAAILGFRQIRLGLTPGWGGAERLLRLLGRGRALHILWEGRDLTGEDAHNLGLVEVLSAPGEAPADALAMARRLSARAPLAIAGVKALLGTQGPAPRSGETAPPDSYSESEAREESIFQRLWASEDHHEAVEAFLQGRAPDFQGR